MAESLAAFARSVMLIFTQSDFIVLQATYLVIMTRLGERWVGE